MIRNWSSGFNRLGISSLVLLGWFIIIQPVLIEDSELFAQQVYVSSVIDGDTFKDSLNNSFRLIGIDAPERNTEEGRISKNFLKDLIEQRYVSLESDSLNDSLDFYGRTLCYVYHEGIDINEFMIKNGYAKTYTKYPFCKRNQYLHIQSKSNDRSSSSIEKAELSNVEIKSASYWTRKNLIISAIGLILIVILIRYYFR
jgi:endonuclease YncB( thermonuclease family)